MARVGTLRTRATEDTLHLLSPLHGGAAETIKPEAILFFPWTPTLGVESTGVTKRGQKHRASAGLDCQVWWGKAPEPSCQGSNLTLKEPSEKGKLEQLSSPRSPSHSSFHGRDALA
ncbi:hypothetical protein KIL84_016580 [Mauremys mutica]|uniref:Uncharacterized protein n=1 Tax=Mauremys mutica TaxID=74926 RepID=A0A9D4AXT8_9SAUR|nr:hypothetical protein KIL84_016580 [Mauremys mutica]